MHAGGYSDSPKHVYKQNKEEHIAVKYVEKIWDIKPWTDMKKPIKENNLKVYTVHGSNHKALWKSKTVQR